MSSNAYLVAAIRFLDPTLADGDIAEIARHYRPLLKLHDEYFTSCVFERIGDGRGRLALGNPILTVIRLPAREQIEAYLGRSMQEIFPRGSLVELVANDIVVANGQAQALLDSLEAN